MSWKTYLGVTILYLWKKITVTVTEMSTLYLSLQKMDFIYPFLINEDKWTHLTEHFITLCNKTEWLISRKHTFAISWYYHTNRSFDNASTFKYLVMALTNKHCIRQQTEGNVNLRNVQYRSVQNLLSSHLLSKMVKIKINKTIPYYIHTKLFVICSCM
jgi:hypothetical protein